jgi:hypothetical protein
VSHALHVRSFFLLLVLSALASVPVFAQMETATLSGAVSDPKGGVVPDVEVTATRIETGSVATTRTNGAGIYSFTGLMPGHYHLMIHKPGFKEIAIKELELHVQDKLEQNFSLEIGSVSETVTVTANDLNVNTTDASVSTVIDRQFVENIPLNGQSFNTLLQLTPGTVITPSEVNAPGQFSINGQRTNANLFSVDGVAANFGLSTEPFGQAGGGGTQGFNAYGGTASLVSVDALQEFRVETSTFAPEYGRTPGGQVSLTTRSGTNGFHGDVFDYFRNTVLDANDWFAKAAGDPRAAEQQNDFGGVFGGPILKDKTFFFFSYEGLRLRQPQTMLIEVPSVSLRQAAIPAAAVVLNAYPLPAPNAPISADGDAAEFIGNYSNRITMDAVSLRIDQTITKKVSLFGRFSYSPSQLITQTNSLSNTQTTPVNTITFTLGSNLQLTDQVTDEVRFNYSRQTLASTFQLDSFGGAVPFPSTTLLPPPYSLSQTSAVFFPFFDGLPVIQLGATAQTSEDQWNVVDGMTVLKGSHQLKFGFDYNRLLLAQGGLPFAPTYYATGTGGQFASTATVPFVQNVTFRPSRILFNELSIYGQDSWKLGTRLTLTYGLRWELNPTPSGQNTVLASWQNVNDPANLALAPIGTPPWKTIYTNFAPRFGLAYRLTPDGDLVLRAGTGIFYDLGTGIASSLAASFPNQANFTGVAGPYPVPITDLAALTPSSSLQPPFPNQLIWAISPNLKLPYSYQWNVAMEKSFHGNQSASITYVGQVGRRLLRSEFQTAPSSDFTGGFTLTDNGDTSNYNALQVQYKKAMSHGIQVLLNYTWSHSIDTNSSDAITTADQGFVPVSGERGSSDFDVRQNFTGAFVYSPPGFKKNGLVRELSEGWVMSGFVLARSGFPIDIYTMSLPFAGGRAQTRPDLVPGQPIWLTGSECLEAPPLGFGQPCPAGKGLNPAAFALPPTPRQGTLPRNSIYGFGATQFDTSLQRNFNITETLRLQFRADAFNVFNHPNFANPQGDFDSGQFGLSYQMLNQGLSSGGAGLNSLYNIGGPRSIQLSLKLFF